MTVMRDEMTDALIIEREDILKIGAAASAVAVLAAEIDFLLPLSLQQGLLLHPDSETERGIAQ